MYRTNHRRSLALAPFLAAFIATAASADLLIVDSAGGPGTDFADLQPAVEAAADGDTILVRAHLGGPAYGTAMIVDKSLTIVGDPDPTVPGPFPNPATNARITSLWVQTLSAGKAVTVRGLSAVSTAPTLLLTDCEGAVTIDRCVFQVNGPPPGALVMPTAFIARSDSVAIVGTTIEGQHGFTGFTGQAASMFDSEVHLLDSFIVGGIGQEAMFPPGGGVQPALPGALGLLVSGGHLRAHGSFVSGGAGGPGAVDAQQNCESPSFGGLGMRMFSGATQPIVELFDSRVEGGPAGGIPS
ncbi:MAG: hypothetical protein ACYTG6_13340, partial [Planctomycetota bacterium]